MSEASSAIAVVEPEDERGVAPGGDDGVGLVGGDHGDGEGAAEPAQHGAGGLGQGRAAGHLLLDEVGHHLGVGGRGHRVPGGLQLGPQLGVVLDDPVVDEGQPAGAVDVRVGVLLGRAAVGGPPGVPDGGAVARGRVGRAFGQRGDGRRGGRGPGPPASSPSATMATPAES